MRRAAREQKSAGALPKAKGLHTTAGLLAALVCTFIANMAICQLHRILRRNMWTGLPTIVFSLAVGCPARLCVLTGQQNIHMRNINVASKAGASLAEACEH